MDEAITTSESEKSNILEKKYRNGTIIKTAEWINNMETGLRMLKEGPRLNIYLDRLKPTLKKIVNGKTPGLDCILGFWFKRFTSIHDRQRYPNEWPYKDHFNLKTLHQSN